MVKAVDPPAPTPEIIQAWTEAADEVQYENLVKRQDPEYCAAEYQYRAMQELSGNDPAVMQYYADQLAYKGVVALMKQGHPSVAPHK